MHMKAFSGVLLWICILSQVLGAVMDVRATIQLISPLRYESVLTESHFGLAASIQINQGQLDKSQVDMCMSIVDWLPSYPELLNGIPVRITDRSLHMSDTCGNSPQTMDGGTGSHKFIGYIKAFEDEEEYILAAVNGVFQILYQHQAMLELSPMLDLPFQYRLLDSITLFEAEIAPNSALLRTHSTYFIGSEDSTIKIPRGNAEQVVNIVIYLKEIQHHGANKRLFHWLFNHARFKENGFCLSVVTGSNNASHNMDVFDKLVNEAGVSVRQYDCLSLDDWMSPEAIRQSLISLSAYLYSNEVQVLIAVNTLGDKLTDNLMEAVDRPFDDQQTLAGKPFVFIDLANLFVDMKWEIMSRTVNGFISLSRFGGSTLELVAEGKPIAVIYPPACSAQWILQSPCYSDFTETTGDSQMRVQISKFQSAQTKLDSQSLNASIVDKQFVVVSGSVRHRVRFITANRLDSDKCPALLLLAVQHIRASLSESELSDFDQLVRFDLYGGGPLLQPISEMIVSLGLDRIVTIRGPASETEVLRAIRRSDVLINPKFIGETFGFVHTEAAAMGLPVIAFRSGANAESVASGVLIDPVSTSAVEDLATAIYGYYQKFSRSDDNDAAAAADLEQRCSAAKSRIAQWNIHRHSDSLMDAVRIVLSEKSNDQPEMLSYFRRV